MAHPHAIGIERDRSLITLANQQTSPLLLLPAELRDNIYQLTFSDSTVFFDERIVVPEQAGVKIVKNQNKSKKLYSNIGLLHSCTQIQREAQAFFNLYCVYDLSMIEVMPSKNLSGVKLNIGNEVLDRIKVIRISQLMAGQLKTRSRDHKPLDHRCWIYSLLSLQRVIVDPHPGNMLRLYGLGPEIALSIRRTFNKTDMLEVDLPTVSDIVKALEEQGAAGQKMIELGTYFFSTMMSMEDEGEDKGWFHREELL